MVLEEAFLCALTSAFDFAGTGTVPRDEWRRCASALGLSIEEETWSRFSAKLDPTGAGMLDHSALRGYGIVSAQIEPLLRVIARALVAGLEASTRMQARVEMLVHWRERELAKQRRLAGSEHRRRIAGRALDAWRQVILRAQFVSRKVLAISTQRASATATKCFHAWRTVRADRAALVHFMLERLLLDEAQQLQLRHLRGWRQQVRDPAFDAKRYTSTAPQLNVWTAALGHDVAYWRRKATRTAFLALLRRAPALRKRQRQAVRAVFWRGLRTWVHAVRAHTAGRRLITAFRHPAAFARARRGLRAFVALRARARRLRQLGGRHLSALPKWWLGKCHHWWRRSARARAFVDGVLSRLVATIAGAAASALLGRWADQVPGALGAARSRALRRALVSAEEAELPSLFRTWAASARSVRLLQPALLEHRFAVAAAAFEALLEPALRKRVRAARAAAARHWALLGPARLAYGGLVLRVRRQRRKRAAAALRRASLLGKVVGEWSKLFARHYHGTMDERLWLAEERLRMLADSKLDRARFAELHRAYEAQRATLEQLLEQLVVMRGAAAGAGAGAGGMPDTLGGGGGTLGRSRSAALDDALAGLRAKTDELAVLYDETVRSLHAKADAATCANLNARLGAQDAELRSHRALLEALGAQLANAPFLSAAGGANGDSSSVELARVRRAVASLGDQLRAALDGGALARSAAERARDGAFAPAGAAGAVRWTRPRSAGGRMPAAAERVQTSPPRSARVERSSDKLAPPMSLAHVLGTATGSPNAQRVAHDGALSLEPAVSVRATPDGASRPPAWPLPLPETAALTPAALSSLGPLATKLGTEVRLPGSDGRLYRGRTDASANGGTPTVEYYVVHAPAAGVGCETLTTRTVYSTLDLLDAGVSSAPNALPRDRRACASAAPTCPAMAAHVQSGELPPSGTLDAGAQSATGVHAATTGCAVQQPATASGAAVHPAVILAQVGSPLREAAPHASLAARRGLPQPQRGPVAASPGIGPAASPRSGGD
ncbi:hypothetical protein KFE25_001128 [Diacronema lutheri]|uniref:Uncharacterized protein n=1 Tax=Diacronema lutheri TaxID=2081491 RepID=A0A8J5XJ62_DIALT|nr:hypothetical protein KFE25_001128 [Diacronema lutheri]